MLPDPFERYYMHLPWFLQFPIYIIVNVVIIRGIIGNSILQEIKQRGVLEHRIVQSMKNHVHAWTVVARKVAIVQHYRTGHSVDNVLDCGQGRCAIL